MELLLFEKHAIAVRVKTILLLDCMDVSVEDKVTSSEGGDEHQQRALRQMEIREHGANDAKLVSGINEKVGFAGAGLDLAGAPSVFQGADGGGSDGDHAALFENDAVDDLGGSFG